LELWIRKLKPGGKLYLYLPHESMMLWRRGGPWVGLGHKWRPTHEVLIPFLEHHGMRPIEFNSSRDSYWSFHIVASRGALPPPGGGDVRRSASSAPTANQNGTVTLSTPR